METLEGIRRWLRLSQMRNPQTKAIAPKFWLASCLQSVICGLFGRAVLMKNLLKAANTCGNIEVRPDNLQSSLPQLMAQIGRINQPGNPICQGLRRKSSTRTSASWA